MNKLSKLSISNNPKIWIVIGVGVAGVVILAEAHRRRLKARNAIKEDFGAFIERFELLPFPQPPPPAARLPLTGLTFAIKDIFDVKGYVTGFGSADWRRTHDVAGKTAIAVTAMLKNGATCVGKTIMDELGFGITGENAHYGAPTNPKLPSHLPGGSSSGSAVAVAAELVDFALGTDTYGCIRIPAAFCGIFGYRPSHGIVSMVGVLPNSQSLDTVGCFARDPSVLHRVGHALLQLKPLEPKRTRRLIIADDLFQLSVVPKWKTLDIVNRVTDKLSGYETSKHMNLGHYISENVPSLKEFCEESNAHQKSISCLKALSSVMLLLQRHEFRENHDEWIKSVKPKLVVGVSDASPDRIKSLYKVRREMRDAFQSLLKDDGILVIPTVADHPKKRNSKKVASSEVHDRAFALLSISTMSGCCQVALPFGENDGYPVSVSFLSSNGTDKYLLDTVLDMYASLQEEIQVASTSAPLPTANGNLEASELLKEKLCLFFLPCSNSMTEAQSSSTSLLFNGVDNPSLQITSKKLTGPNYVSWSQSVYTYVLGRGKKGYLTGSLIAPTDTNSKEFDTWETEDAVVRSWLMNSMMEKISSNFLYAKSAHSIWKKLESLYSNEGNYVQVYGLKLKLRNTVQSGQPINEYFNTLTNLWEEYDQLTIKKWKCTEDAGIHNKEVERDRLLDFLGGLDITYEAARERILAISPFPSIDDAFSILRKEECRRGVMPIAGGILPTPGGAFSGFKVTESGCIISETEAANAAYNRSKRSENWANLLCDHCKKKGHIKEKCWLLHGKPPHLLKNQPGKTEGRGKELNRAYNVAEQKHGFSEEQLHTLQMMFSKLQPQPTESPIGAAAHEEHKWIVDSGASSHMTGDFSVFETFTSIDSYHYVTIADGSSKKVLGKGRVKLQTNITLEDVLYVPNLNCNLLSVKQFCRDRKCSANFLDTHCEFQDLESMMKIGSAKSTKGGLYLFHSKLLEETSGLVASLDSKCNKILHLHFRLGHPNFVYLKKLYPLLFSGVCINTLKCESCILGKQTRNVYKSIPYTPTAPFTLVHTDVWGPSRVSNLSKKPWFVTFIDDHSRTSWVYLMNQKSDVATIFTNFYTFVETQFKTKIQILRSDNGTEYFNSQLSPFLTEKGIVHQSSCTNTPQQNGVAERKNRHLLEVARTLMFTYNVPIFYWCQAVLTATYLINRMPSRQLKFRNPINVLKGTYPDTKLLSDISLKIFGCTAFVHNHNPQRGKLDPRSVKTIFLGYSPTKRGYKCFDPKTHKTYVTFDVTFIEDQPFYAKSEIKSLEQNLLPENTVTLPISVDDTIMPTYSPTGKLTHQPEKEAIIYTRNTWRPEPADDSLIQPIQETEHSSTLPTSSESCTDLTPPCIEPELPIALRKGRRNCTQHPIQKFVAYCKVSQPYQAFLSNIDTHNIPKSIEHALSDPNWKNAVLEELSALDKNHTWDCVLKPQGVRPVGCRWLFTIKHNSDGTINRYKARLVAKGFTQTQGIDFNETFAPVAKLNSVRILISIAAVMNWPLYQLDIKNAFLNGDLKEEVYMHYPPGFMIKPNHVLKLNKAIYGLKQSPRAWFDRFTKAMKEATYHQGHSDHTMFYKHGHSGRITILIVYVDDIIITGNSEEEISSLKTFLNQQFEVKDLGTLKYFLGIEVARSSKGILLTQRKYTMDLLSDYGLLGCKPVSTPLDNAVNFGKDDTGPDIDAEKYQKLIGRLIYLSHTRPDISFAVSTLSQFMHSPKEIHYNAAVRLLRFLKENPGKGILFRTEGNKRIEAYVDADWAGCNIDRKSTSGWCIYVFGNLVSWRSKKQSVVARSSAEAEYRAIAVCMCEILWVQKLMKELRLVISTPTCLYSDSQSAIEITKNPVQHDRTKHIEIDRHFIKEKMIKGQILLSYINSKNQVADVFTKSLPGPSLTKCIDKLGLLDIYIPA